MKMSSFSIILRVAVLSGLVTAGLLAAAQPGNGGTTGGPAAPDPTAVPIDGGAGLLLASSIAYGLRRLRRFQR